MTHILTAISAVLPVFIIIAIGAYLKKIQLINDDFVTKAMKLVFNICLPGMLFMKVSKSDFSLVFQSDSLVFIIFVALLTIFLFILTKIFANHFVYPSTDRGTFVQGAYRSNYIIIGYSVLYSLFGDDIVSRMALLVIVVIPLYNILAIWVLSEKNEASKLRNLISVLPKILKNPLIIGIFLGFLAAFFKVELPSFLESTIKMLGDVGTPLGLLGIGSYMTFSQLSSIKVEMYAVTIKVVIAPFIAVLACYLLGFSYLDTTLIFVLFASPAAVTSFIMASAMGGNKKLAANIVILSTAFSLITFIIGLTILANLYAI